MSQHDAAQPREHDAPEPDYEPPKAEVMAGEDRTATASWITTGFQPPR